MAKIELRLSSIDPPTPDPPRTIYRDIYNLPSTTYLGLTGRYFNFDDVTLYFQITGTGPGYTFSTVNLGSLASGTSAYINLDNFASRSRPASELTQTVDLILRAYTDSGYSNLKWTFTRTVTVIWINSADPSYTQDVLNNFDDGTVQGWAVLCETQCDTGLPDLGVTTDYALSPPNSLRMRNRTISGKDFHRGRLYKSFTTPDRNKVYAIFDVRTGGQVLTAVNQRVLIVRRDSTVLIYLGTTCAYVAVDAIPEAKWFRIVVPLPRNTSLEIQIAHCVASYVGGGYSYLYMDDFKIISKN